MTEEMKKRPRYNRWYKVPLPECISGDGSGYHFYISKGHSRNLIIFFAGGGVVWNSFTAAHPTGAAGVLAGDPGFYWANLRPVTEFMNINQGITENRGSINWFYDWNMAVIAYSTGDFHLGRNRLSYDKDDPEKIMYFNGYNNYSAAIEEIKRIFPEPVNLLIAGDSAGGFGAAALAEDIMSRYDPERSRITLCSDSSLLPWDGWKIVMRDLWNTVPEIYEKIKTENPVADWFESVYKKYGGAVRLLYACSRKDEVLASYWNSVRGNDYGADPDIREEFEQELRKMVYGLMEMIPGICFYINDYKFVPDMPGGIIKTGTVHTCIRNPLFFTGKTDGINMHEWLKDMVNGECYSVGMSILSEKRAFQI